MKIKPKKIFLYDVSTIIHSGSKSHFRKKWNVMGVPTGGVGLLLAYVTTDLISMKNNREYVMAACFDSPTHTGLRRKLFTGYKMKRGAQRHPLNEASCAIDGQELIKRFINEWKESVIAAIRVKGIHVSENASAEDVLKILANHSLDLTGELLGETGEGEEVSIQVGTTPVDTHSDKGGETRPEEYGDDAFDDDPLGVKELREERAPQEKDDSVWGPSPYNPSTGYYYIDGRYIHKDDWDGLPSSTREIVVQEYSVSLQLKLAWELLAYIGVDCYLYEGVEADDIIYSFVIEYPNSPTLIRADDADLRDCYLYNSMVTIKSAANRGKLDLGGNYSELYRKTFEGCLSDNVPSLIKTGCLPYRQELADCMIKGVFNPYSVKSGDGEFGKFTSEPLKALGIADGPAELLATNFYLVYPFLISVPVKYTEVDTDRLVDVLSMLHMRKNLAWLGRERCVSWQMRRYMDNALLNVPEYFKKWLGDGLFVPAGDEGAGQMFNGEAEALASVLNNI